jgi:hypothetical protein
MYSSPPFNSTFGHFKVSLSMHDLHYSVEDHSHDENSDQDVDLNPINTQKNR